MQQFTAFIATRSLSELPLHSLRTWESGCVREQPCGKSRLAEGYVPHVVTHAGIFRILRTAASLAQFRDPFAGARDRHQRILLALKYPHGNFRDARNHIGIAVRA